MKGMICVGCGGDATEGSVQHPYCKKCFKQSFKNYEEYWEWMDKEHDLGTTKAYFLLLFLMLVIVIAIIVIAYVFVLRA